MADAAPDSVPYYDRNAARFEASTADADLSAPRDRFLRRMPPGARILDAGCGVGRDARAFADLGYRVTALDASFEMVRLARKRVDGRAEIVQTRFEEMTWMQEFDGAWACASLLHVPRNRFGTVIARLADAMRPGAACYMSFKYGVGESCADDRCFTNHTEATLTQALHETGFSLDEIWVSGDVRPGRNNERWLNGIAIMPSNARLQRGC